MLPIAPPGLPLPHKYFEEQFHPKLDSEFKAASEQDKLLYIDKIINKLEENNDITVIIPETDFNLLCDKRWKALCNALQIDNSKVKRLLLPKCNLGNLNPKRWQEFCNVIATQPSITYLDLNQNHLDQLNEESWLIFANTIAKNKTLRKLFLNQNFKTINTQKWEIFCSIIRDNKTLTRLDLSDDFNSFQDLEWQRFCNAIAKSTGLIQLYLNMGGFHDQNKNGGIDDPKLNEQRWKLFCESLDKSRIVKLDWPRIVYFFTTREKELNRILISKLERFSENYSAMNTLGQMLYCYTNTKNARITGFNPGVVKNILSFIDNEFLVNKSLKFLSQYQDRKNGKKPSEKALVKQPRGLLDSFLSF